MISLSPPNLCGQLLLANPQMHDAMFRHSVIFVCHHDKTGAVGLIVNRPLEALTLIELMAQLHVQEPERYQSDRVYFGGPIDVDRGFVIHTTEIMTPFSVEVIQSIAVTTNAEVFQHHPQNMRVTMGYAGWEADQLEHEIQQGQWLTLPATPALLFESEDQNKWALAMRQLGIEHTSHVSPFTGRA